MDLQDPMRLRLMSHLQMYANSRTSMVTHHPSSPLNPSTYQPPTSMTNTHAHNGSWSAVYNPAVHQPCESFDPLTGYFPGSTRQTTPTSTSTSEPPTSLANLNGQGQPGVSAGHQYMPSSTGFSSAPPGHFFPSPGQSYLPGVTPSSLPTSGAGGPGKPYRPWGAEMACWTIIFMMIFVTWQSWLVHFFGDFEIDSIWFLIFPCPVQLI